MGLGEIQWDKDLQPSIGETIGTWAAQPGSQQAFLKCPVFEVLYEGTRGPGKTDALIMDYAQHVGKGFGADWVGILFRQQYPMLADVVGKTKKWFPQFFPSATFNEAKMYWGWPSGERLYLRHIERDTDYYKYHGHSYPWIAFEELTTWPNDTCYRLMMSCSRSTNPNMPRKYRSTTNPYGVGHNWVKARFRLPAPHGQIIGRTVIDGNNPPRVAIHGHIRENKILMKADPDYIHRIEAAARNPSERAAWIDGSWDIIAGGMFDDLWAPEFHILPDIPMAAIPKGWRLNRSYDHGQSAPFSVGWWAQSNGEPIKIGSRTIGAVPGDLIRVAEWYGWNGVPNGGLRMLSVDIAKEVARREVGGPRFHPGPADSSIFDEWEPGKSVAGDMAKNGVRWTPADKGPGSRKQGWDQMRKLLKAAIPGKEGVREDPGLFVCEGCEQFIRTIPVLPRDTKDPDDADTEAEDHIADEVRYRCREKLRGTKSWSWID